MNEQAAIGVFDSGVGGLSLLKDIHQALPLESTIYIADSAYAPYGDKPVELIYERCCQITEYLISKQVKIIVIACNTATVSVIERLRKKYSLPFIGIEPAIKPAILNSQSKVVGVLATRQTINSTRLQSLIDAHTTHTTQVHLQACPGLADLIEQQGHGEQLEKLLMSYLQPLLHKQVDTIVLACTHYPFVQPEIKHILQQFDKSDVRIIEPGLAVAKQLKWVLNQNNLLNKNNHTLSNIYYTSGNVDQVKQSIHCLLNMDVEVSHIIL